MNWDRLAVMQIMVRITAMETHVQVILGSLNKLVTPCRAAPQATAKSHVHRNTGIHEDGHP